MDFTGFAFDPGSVMAFYVGCWLLGVTAGGLAAAVFAAVGRRDG